MANTNVGSRAPDFALADLQGQRWALRDFRGQPVLLVFLRHLGWLPCREHVAQLRHHETELHALNVQVLTISFSTEYWARGWLQETASPFPLLRDPERSTYAAYQLSSSRLGAWSPRTLWHYFRLRLGGTRRLPAQGDPHQMGGDFIVDAGGVLRLSHKSKDPVDRPDVALLLETLRNLPYRR